MEMTAFDPKQWQEVKLRLWSSGRQAENTSLVQLLPTRFGDDLGKVCVWGGGHDF